MSLDEQAIRAVQAAWFEATAAGDVERLKSLMSEDVEFLSVGQAPFGRDQFIAAFVAGWQKVRIACRGGMEDIQIHGDLAYARSRLEVTVTPLGGGEARRLSGYVLSIFRRQPNGQWVLARDANMLKSA